MSASNKNYFFQSGGGGSSTGTGTGAKNYISNSTFETNLTTSWSLAHSTITSSLPVTVATATNSFSSAGGVHGGSAANGNLSFTTVSSGKLAGTYSGSYASSAATTVGDMLISDSFAIDIEDQAKVLTFKFYYQAQTGTANCNFSGTSSNSYAVFIYDVTNGAWIQPQGVYSMVQGTGVGYATGTFQTTSNSTNYQLAIVNLNATAGAATIYVDDIILGPQTAPFGPAMSDWGTISWAPTGTWTGTGGSSFTGKWRREGDTMFLNAKVSLTSGPTGTFTLNLPAGYTIDTTKISDTSLQTLGNAYCSTGGGAANFWGNVVYSTTSAVKIISTGFWNATLPGTFANADLVNLIFQVPIVGWSSNSAMSSDTDTRVVACQVQTAAPTATITGSFSLLKFGSGVLSDSHGAFSTSTGLYTCPVSGYYRVSSSITIGATYSNTSNSGVGIAKNGTVILSALQTAGAAELNMGPTISGTVLCNAGDTLAPYVFSNAVAPVVTSNTTYNWVTFERLSGPAVISATESVNARYTNTAGTSIANSGDVVVPFATKDYDSHNAFVTDTYTVPVSGTYQVDCVLNFASSTYAASNNIGAAIYKNGAAVEYGPFTIIGGTPTASAGVNISTTLKLVAGDTIVCRVNNTRTAGATLLSTTTGFNSFKIKRTGN